MRNRIWILLTFITAFLFLFLSYLPNLYEASVTDIMPHDRIMLWGEHIYTYDYNVYLSKIRQGEEGRWTVVDKYDNHVNQQGVLLQMLYLLSGKAGALLSLTPALTFHLLRTSLSFIWVLTIILLNLYFLKKPKPVFVGVLLSLFASSWPVFYRYNNEWWAGYHLAWWTEMDVLKRISYIPHYTLNYITISTLSLLLAISGNRINFLVFNFYSIFNNRVFKLLKINNFNFIKNLKLKISNFVLICIILLFSFFVHPSAGVLFFFSWFLFNLIQLIWDLKSYILHLTSYISKTIILLIVALIPLLYIQRVTSYYPWKSLVDFDKYSRFPLDVKEYVLALGPVFFSGLLGALLVLLKKEKKLLSLVTWILGAFLAIYVFKKFPFQSELRFVQTANHVPLAILTVYLLTWLTVKIRSIYLKIASALVVLTIVALGLIQAYFSIRAQTDFIHQRAVAVQPLVPYPPQVMYPLKDFWNALLWLESHTRRSDVVLSEVTAGNYIPAYSGNFVYVGHNPETPHYDDKVNQTNLFFSGTMIPYDAKNFLTKEGINYVFYGPQEKEKSVEDLKKYEFLKKVFESYYVTIYKIEI